MKRDQYSRWYSAYQAFMRAKNPQFQEYWLGVMNHFRKEFN